MLNTTLTGRTFALHASCCEIFGPRLVYEHVRGLEISKSTQNGWRPSKLKCQVLAALQQRIACVSNAVQRDALLRDMALWLETRKQHTVQDLVTESFWLNAQHAEPIPEHLSAVGAEDIAIKAAVQESFVEDSLHMLSLGTKEALTLGLHRFGMMHCALQKDPAVPLSKMPATLYAISDLFGDLKASRVSRRHMEGFFEGNLRCGAALRNCRGTSSSGKPYRSQVQDLYLSNCIVVGRASQ